MSGRLLFDRHVPLPECLNQRLTTYGRWIHPGYAAAVAEAGRGMLDPFHLRQDLVDGERTGVTVEPDDGDLDSLQIGMRHFAEWLHREYPLRQLSDAIVEPFHDLQRGGIPKHVTLSRVAERHFSSLIIYSLDPRFGEFLKLPAEGSNLFRDEQSEESKSYFMGSVKFVVRPWQFFRSDRQRPQGR